MALLMTFKCTWQLGPALKTCAALTNLDLGGNNIGAEGIHLLLDNIKGNSALMTLELGYNPFGPEGAKYLTDALKFDLKISVLKLGWCKIGGGDGAKAIADLIMYNDSLSELDLRGNNLGNDGAIFLSRGLKAHQNPKLKELDLGYNEIKDDGACALGTGEI